jgi:valyl-tRNA synthetase
LDKNADINVGRWIVARNVEEAREKAVGKFGDFIEGMEQDEDVLDTWFSSGLFPFAVFGWQPRSSRVPPFF